MSASTSNLPSSPSSVPPSAGENAAPATPAWKNEVSERVRAHRTRRVHASDDQPALPGMENASSIAARVAQRYARVPSYRDMLAAQAAAQAEAAAKAAAEAAARAAEAAQQAAALHAAQAQPEPAAFAVLAVAPPSISEALPEPEAVYVEPASEPWQPDLLRYFVSSDSLPTPRSTPIQARAEATASVIRHALAEVIDPLEEAIVEPAHPLPARVIEFPRELVAPRKARPRLAEGPLRDEAAAAARSTRPSTNAVPGAGEPPHSTGTPNPPAASSFLSGAGELRIFEAEPEAPSPAPAQDLSEWHSIHLDAEESMPEPKRSYKSSLLDDLPLHVASFGDRVMAGVVDVALTLAAFLLFVMVFAACTTHPPAGRVAVAGAAVTLLAMWMVYQVLFFSLTNATPGMRYAKIALCTFDDENPTRAAMRGRILAMLISALPLGLGFVWAVFDEDALSWHDRITQTYQRSYRDL